tara:strand:- start:901 stop:1575 length:675 start_codon:yes stop_codon:yes gene_type:complete
MVSIYDVDARLLIARLADKLSKEIEMPSWAKFVKTGSHRERPPVQENWWYIRAAAILRTIYKNGPVGVSKLRSKYGGAKNRGRKKHRFTKGSGKVLRVIVQQLEEKGYLKRADKGKGRLVTSSGQSFLEKTASEVYTKFVKPVKIVAKPVKVAPKVEVKPVEKKVEVKKEVPKKTAVAPIEKKSVKKAEPKAKPVVKKVAKPKKAAPKKPAAKKVAKKAPAKKK